jgi:hypothetical protein
LPRVEDLSRHLDLTSPEPITLNLDDRQFCLPPGTRYYRWGLTQEGVLVEYQDADGGWRAAAGSTERDRRETGTMRPERSAERGDG